MKMDNVKLKTSLSRFFGKVKGKSFDDFFGSNIDRFDRLVARTNDKELQKKIWFLSISTDRLIAQRRMEELASPKDRPLPLNYPDLGNISHDEQSAL